MSDSIYNGPAFKAASLRGTKLAGVNGQVYSRDLLNHAIKAGTLGGFNR